ncbi:MAG: hypothetical protein KGL53_01100, partial [Elusimicrobia bacterium]|nr:hypothetical protein [Elusimicrobiota bacterium]
APPPGYALASSARARVKGGTLAASVYRKDDGSERLYVTLAGRRGTRTLHLELGGAARLELASVHDRGDLPDLFGDGSRVVAYRSVLPALSESTLLVFRYASGRLTLAGRVPGGRFKDVDGDGRPEVVGRERPLGALFSIGCRSFHAMAQSAWRTDVYALAGGRLVKASARYRPFFDARIARTRAEVSAVDARSTDDYGGFLGKTLSLYFDYAESGRAREGWREFEALYPVRASDPAPVKKCLRQMEATLKDRLAIPADW